jgi:hypothetical protein
LKDLLRELAIITAGILIALGFDGLVQWWHHHQLAREARANIVSELRENQQELAKEIQALQNVDKQGQELVALVHQLEVNRKTPVHQASYSFTMAELHATSWNTASTTGALSYMPYAEVKKYTQVYDLQRAYDAVQQRALEGSLDVEGLFTLLGRDAGSLTRAELSDAERRIGIAVANARALQQVAEPLNQRYQEVLKTAQ